MYQTNTTLIFAVTIVIPQDKKEFVELSAKNIFSMLLA